MTDFRIRRAFAADYPAMAEIWHECFGDDLSNIQFFLQNRLSSCLAFTGQTDKKTVGAVYLLPAMLYDAGIRRRAYYVYALGVLPEYRGRGIASRMMQHIFGTCQEQNAVCFLKPASPSLAVFYEGLGMHPTHYAAEQRFPSSERNPLTWLPLSADDYAERHLSVPPCAGGVLWDANAIRYAVAENKLCGGFCLCGSVGGESCAVLGRKEKDLLRIEDCIGADPKAVLPALCAHLGAKEAILRVPCDPADPDAFLIGMTYTMNVPASGPFRLLLDG